MIEFRSTIHTFPVSMCFAGEKDADSFQSANVGREAGDGAVQVSSAPAKEFFQARKRTLYEPELDRISSFPYMILMVDDCYNL